LKSKASSKASKKNENKIAHQSLFIFHAGNVRQLPKQTIIYKVLLPLFPGKSNLYGLVETKPHTQKLEPFTKADEKGMNARIHLCGVHGYGSANPPAAMASFLHSSSEP
jgi:hypothetical protein